jgi:hypothetical protein
MMAMTDILVDSRLDRLEARLDRIDDRFDRMRDERFWTMHRRIRWVYSVAIAVEIAGFLVIAATKL